MDESKDAPDEAFAVGVDWYIRDDWIRKQMRDREPEFTEYCTVRVFVGTWNVNGKKPTESLDSWLLGGEPSKPEVYVIGFQEMVDLNTTNVVLDSKSQTRTSHWERTLEENLNNAGETYVMLMSKHLVGILLCVYVKEELAHEVSDVQGCTAGVGIMGVMGNKGGAAIRMTLYDSTMCFVCSHLAAHRDHVEQRNSDFANIIHKIYFKNEAEARAGGSMSGGHGGHGPGCYSLLDHDYVMWLGDLNYRIMCDISIDECFDKIESGDLAFLREKDQLNIERRKGTVFQGFEEGELAFLPTYKYQPGSNSYERRPDKKLRAPAWCDRILWKCREDFSRVKQLFYTRSELTVSDHKPVSSVFEVQVKTIIKERQKEIYTEIMRKLDLWENEKMPRVSIDKTLVCFKQVRFGSTSRAKLVVENTGQVVAKFRFVPKLSDKRYCKPWLSVDTPFGIILPGETTEIELSAHVDRATAHDLSCEKDTLDDILVLRLENGRDYFVSVTGEYLKSCFGASLEQLVRTVEPIRYSDTIEPKRDSARLSIPKELWRMVDYIFRNCMDDRGLFVERGSEEDIFAIREALDVGSEFPELHNVHSMGEALLELLKALKDPVIPGALFPHIDFETANLKRWSRRFLDQMPVVSYNCFVYIISFLREVLKHRERNKLTVERLALVFGTCLLRPPDDPAGAGESRYQGKMQSLVAYFLTADLADAA